MSTNKRDDDVITLGSGDLMIKSYSGTMPAYTDFTDSDLIGRIKGGATLEYSGEWYTAKDDTGKVVKTIIVDETAVLKSGIITWNGNVLKKLCSTARVTEAGGIRTVKIGGPGNQDKLSYAICFHHTDPADGDVWLLMKAVNQGGLSLAFVKDQETVIDAEFSCLPSDDEGTLVTYYEQMTPAG